MRKAYSYHAILIKKTYQYVSILKRAIRVGSGGQGVAVPP